MAEQSWRILVVEDDEFFRMLLSEGLRAHGHKVETADDGVQAQERVRRGGLDFVVTDVMMPNLDGHGLVKWIRETEQRSSAPRLPVVAATACIQPEDVDAVASGQFDAWILKPYEMGDVIAALENLALAREA